MNDNNALVPAAAAAPLARPTGPLRPVVSPAALIEAHKEAADVLRSALEDGRDYGAIPGAGPKKVLLKPGAERLCVAFGLQPVYSLLSSETDHDREVHYSDRKRGAATSVGLYRFVVKCQLTRDGVVVGEGIGSCSTMEQKYVSRPRDSENTVLKMAKKRALVDAVLGTLSLSDRFTQDVGDDEVDPVDAPPPKPKLDRDALVAEVGQLFGRLNIADADRKEHTWRILGRRPDSLQDLVIVRDTLAEQLEGREGRAAKSVDAELVND